MKKSWERYFTLFALTALGTLQAQPSGFQVVAGEASKPVALDKNTLQINTGKNTIIHWDSFSIAKNEVTKFVMPDKSSAVLNRVTGKALSELQGMLQANGKLFLINPNGILIGPEGQINAASFFASTLDILNEDFLQKGELLFAGDSLGKVINLGKIQAWDGDVVLIGRFIDNRGHIDAAKGTAALAVGSEVLLKLSGNERVFIRAATMADDQAKSEDPGIDHTGTINALQVELKADGNPYSLAIKDAGKIDALGLKEQAGRVFLVANEGRVEVTDSITANSGEVHILGKQVILNKEMTVDVSGKMGGGTLLIGGDYQGKNPLIPNADFTHVGEHVVIHADATENGNGGKVILWGTSAAQFLGAITAKGGQQSGDGGFVEVSSKGYLAPRGSVDTTAPFGETGQLLFDPCTVTVSTAATTGGLMSPGGVYDFTGFASANINNLDLDSLLGTNNVTINASSTGTGTVGSITVVSGAPVQWSSVHSLTLVANDDPLASSITLQDRLIALNTTKLGTAPIVTVTSPNIFIGKTAGNLSTQSGIEVSSGQVIVNGGNLTLTGSNNNTTDADAVIRAGTSANDQTAPGSGSIVINLVSGGGIPGNCVLIAGTSTVNTGNHQAAITTTGSGGPVTCTIAGDYTLTSGSGPAAGQLYDAIIIAGDGDSTPGDVNNLIISGTNYTLTAGGGGNPSGNDASIRGSGGGGTSIGSISLTATGNISITGGTTLSGDGIINTNGTGSGDNSITVDMSGGTITVLGANSTGLNRAGFVTQGPSAGITINGAGDITLKGGQNNSNAQIATNSTSMVNPSPINITCNSLTLNNASPAVGTNGSSFITTDVGTITVTPTTFVSLLGGPQSGASANIEAGTSGNGNVTIHNMTGDLTLTGGSGSGSFAQIESDNGTVHIFTVGGNLNLSGGSTSGASAEISAPNGSITINSVVGNLALTAGTAANCFAEITTNNAGNIIIGQMGGIGGNLTLQAGTGTDAIAGILATGGGDIQIGSIAGTATLTGANTPGSGSTAQIEVTGGTGTITFNGTVTGNFTIQGGSGSNCGASITTSSGDIAFSNPLSGSLLLSGGNSTGSSALIFAGNGGGGSTGTVLIDSIGVDLLLTGGGPAVGGGIAAIETDNATGNITIGQIGGDLTLQGGSGGGATAEILANAGGTILFNGTIGGDVSLNGGNTTAVSQALIQVNAAAGDVTFSGAIAGNVSLQGGNSSNSGASILTSNGNISFSSPISQSMTLAGSATASTSSASIAATGNGKTVFIDSIGTGLILTGGAAFSTALITTNGTAGNITVGTIGGALTVLGGSVSSAMSQILAMGGGNILLGSTGGIGGSVSVTARAALAEIGVTGTGNITFGQFIHGLVHLQGGAGAQALISTSAGNISFPDISQSMTLNVGTLAASDALITATGVSPLGIISINSIGSNLVLTAGADSSVASIMTTSTAGDITIGPITGNLTLTAGSGVSASAEIIANNDGDILFSGTIGGDVELTGGSTGANSIAEISGVNVTFSGAVAGNVTLQAGAGDGCSANIQAGNDLAFSPGGIAQTLTMNGGGGMASQAFMEGSDAVIISSIGGSLLLHGGSGSSSIATIDSNNASSSITIGTITGDLTLTAGSSATAHAEIIGFGGGNIFIGTTGGIGGTVGVMATDANAGISVVGGPGSVTFGQFIHGGVTLQGTTGGQAVILTSSGSISFPPITQSVSLTGGTGAGSTASITAGGGGNVTFNTSIGSNVVLTGGNSATSPVIISAPNGSVTFPPILNGGSVQLFGATGGAGTSSSATIRAGGAAHAVTFGAISGSLTLTGGDASNASASIISTSNNVSIGAVAGAVTLTGGSATGTLAQISAAGGTVGIAAVGTNLSLNGGSNTGAVAEIVTANASGNVTIGPIAQNLLITGGNGTIAGILLNGGGTASFGSIGGVVTVSGGSAGTSALGQIAVSGGAGNVTFGGPIAGNVTVRGGGGNSATASISTSNGSILFPTIPNGMLITGGGTSSNATINAGGATGDVTFPMITNNLILTANVGTGTSSIIAGRDITVHAGQNIQLSSANLTSPTLTATGSITTTSGQLTFLNHTSFFQVGNTMSVTAGTNVELQNASHFTGSTGPMTVIAGIDVNLSGSSTFTHSGSGDLTVTAGNDILLDGLSTILFDNVGGNTGNIVASAGVDILLTTTSSIGYLQGTGNVTATAGHNISLDDVSSMTNAGSGLLLGIAGVAVIVTDTSAVSTTTGNLTLVSDNDFPTPFGVGPGFFDLDATSTVSTTPPGSPGTVRIYTAIREQNTVDGLINGAPFVYGTEFVDTTTEQWLTWYPGTPTPVDPAPPTTILYKNDAIFPPPPPPPPPPPTPFIPSIIGKITEEGGVAISQMFYIFTNEFRDYVYYFDIMKVMYDHKAYASKRHDIGVLTSYDVDPDLKLFIMRTKYMDQDGQLVPNYIYKLPR